MMRLGTTAINNNQVNNFMSIQVMYYIVVLKYPIKAIKYIKTKICPSICLPIEIHSFEARITKFYIPAY